jgi:hypothetical protein
VFDDVTEDTGVQDAASALQRGRKGSGSKKAKGTTARDEMKTVTEIRKEREKKDKNVLKNMKKGDRRQLEGKQRSERAAAQDDPAKKGVKAKKGQSGRWKGSHKKGGKR